jgi:hypothetical protein
MYKFSFLEILIMNNSPYSLDLGKRRQHIGRRNIYGQGTYIWTRNVDLDIQVLII